MAFALCYQINLGCEDRMKNNTSKLISGALLVIGLGGAVNAQAGHVDFTFNGANSSSLGTQASNVVSNTVATYSVAIKPYSMDLSVVSPSWSSLFVAGASLTNDLRISRNTDALGVNRPGNVDNANQIDSYGNSVEGLLFDFGLASWGSLEVTLRGLNTQDRFDVWMGDSFNGSSATLPLAQVVAGTLTGSVYEVSDFNHRYLFIAARDDGNSGTDCRTNSANQNGTRANCFQVDNIRAIPEPGSMAMLGLGLLAMGGVLRRRIAGK